MKTLSQQQLTNLAGEYYAPAGLYEYTKSLPFLGTVQCSAQSLVAGQWTELLIEYTVGGSGLADGAWIKGTFKFYSDWALFQTTHPKEDNYVSAEYRAGELHAGQTPATVQSLAVRFDQKGHERPFQKAIVIDLVDGYMNPGDKILVRIGDRRWGAKGTRVQTFVEKDFLMRWYIDPVGTSRFAPIKPDLALQIVPGPIAKAKVVCPRLVGTNVRFPIHIHAEDAWGNATVNIQGLRAKVSLTREDDGTLVWDPVVCISETGWSTTTVHTALPTEGHYALEVTVTSEAGLRVAWTTEPISVTASLPVPRPLYADLHVHSDDTVGTNSTTYNFSYAQYIAGLDVVGYTANDFNITAAKWRKTLDIIKEVNAEGEFVLLPGTEWCGNSAAGGDHNVIFLDDPTAQELEFPLDRNGNVARSFEWNEDGPAELVPGAWPLDEVYATYAHAPESHLLMPHVGGRRCNLAWHHPKLERLLEIGSAWGLFEWLLRDAVQRGYKLGVSANSDEHRGRCGGGVPGTAVFGVKGGLTGILADKLDRVSVGRALRARRTFATTGERLVGLVMTGNGELQGDDVQVQLGQDLELKYAFYGSQGFSSIEAWDATGQIFLDDLQRKSAIEDLGAKKKVRVKWGGARLYDRYKEAIWEGVINVQGAGISEIRAFGGVEDVPSETVKLFGTHKITFDTHTSGDFDGVDIWLNTEDSNATIELEGTLGGYVKVGNALGGNPHKPQPDYRFTVSYSEALQGGGRRVDIPGGAELFISVEVLNDVPLPIRVTGEYLMSTAERQVGETQAVYFVAREWNGGKVITSPMFIEYQG